MYFKGYNVLTLRVTHFLAKQTLADLIDILEVSSILSVEMLTES